jgi:hypothetical protein
MTAIARDLTLLRHQRNLVRELATRIERGGEPGVAECVRIQADQIHDRLSLRLEGAERMRKDFQALSEATTERVRA